MTMFPTDLEAMLPLASVHIFSTFQHYNQTRLKRSNLCCFTIRHATHTLGASGLGQTRPLYCMHVEDRNYAYHVLAKDLSVEV